MLTNVVGVAQQKEVCPCRQQMCFQNYAGVAQQVERVLGKDEVGSPSLLISSTEKGNANAFPFSVEKIGRSACRPKKHFPVFHIVISSGAAGGVEKSHMIIMR